MGNCLRKPMKDADDKKLLAPKIANEPSFAPVEEEDIPKRPAGLHESPLATLNSKKDQKKKGDDDDADDEDEPPRRKTRKPKSKYDDDDENDEDEEDRRPRGRRNTGKKNRSYDADEDDEEEERPRSSRTKKRDEEEEEEEDEKLDDRRRRTSKKNTSRSRNDDDEEEDEAPAKAAPTKKAAAAAPPPAKNPFADDEEEAPPAYKSTTMNNKKPAVAAPVVNPFDDDEEDTRSFRTTATAASKATLATRATAVSTPADDFSSIRSKATTATTTSSNFAQEARTLQKNQLAKVVAPPVANPFGDSDDDASADDDDKGNAGGDVVTTKPKLTQFGQMKKKVCSLRIAVNYDVSRGALDVHIHELEGLSERRFGKPSLYIKLYVSPDPKRKTKRKTQVFKGVTNPNFDEKFEFKIPATDIHMKSLRLALWEEGVISNSSLGELSIGFSNYAHKGDFTFNDFFVLSRRSRSAPPKDGEAASTSAISGPEDSDDDAKSVRSVRSTNTTGSQESRNNPFGDSDDDARSVMSSGSVISVTPTPTKASLKKKKLANIKLAVGYNATTCTLRVHVQEVGELPWEQETKPDLYVKMFVAPDPKKETKRKTRVVNASINPKFDELFEWQVTNKDIKEKSLIVSLCEEGTLSNDILGELSISFVNFDGDFEWNDWFALNKKPSNGRRMSLTKRRIAPAEKHVYTEDDNSDARSVRSSKSGFGGGSDEVIKPQLTEAGSGKVAIAHVKLDISYEAARGTFKIHIHKIKGLLNFPPMDLYLIIWLHPDEKTTKRETPVKRNTKTPDFDEVYEFKYAVGEVQRKSLFIQLWQDLGEKKKDKMLAQVSIGFKSTEGSNFAWSDWYALFEKRK